MHLDVVCNRRQVTRGLGATLLALGLVESSPRLEAFAALSPAAAAVGDDWTELWTLQTDSDSLGRPQLVNGVLYVAGSGLIRAVDPATGRELWSVRGAEQFTVANGALYAFFHDGDNHIDRLIARDVASAGEVEVWVVELGGRLVWDSPLTVTQEGVLLALIDDGEGVTYSLTAFNLADGSVRWRFGGERARHPSFRFTYADGTAFVPAKVDDEEYLIALDAATGEERWSQTLTSHDLGGDDVIVAGNVVAHGGLDMVSVRDAATGDLLWRTSVGDGYVFVEAIAAGQLYVSEHPDTDGDNSVLHAIDLTTQEERWASIKIPVRSRGNVAPGDGVVFVSYYQKGGGVVVFDAGSGERIARFHAGSPVRGLAVAGNLVFVTSNDGIVRALRFDALPSPDISVALDEQTLSDVSGSATTAAFSRNELE